MKLGYRQCYHAWIDDLYHFAIMLLALNQVVMWFCVTVFLVRVPLSISAFYLDGVRGMIERWRDFW